MKQDQHTAKRAGQGGIVAFDLGALTSAGDAPLVAVSTFIALFSLLHTAQGSDATLIVWSVLGLCFCIAIAQSAWLPRPRTKGRDSDILICVWLAKLIVASGTAALSMWSFDRPDISILISVAVAGFVLAGLAVGLSRRPNLTLAAIILISAGIVAVTEFWVPVTAMLYLLTLLFISLAFVAMGLVRIGRPNRPALQYDMRAPVTAGVARWSDILLAPLLLQANDLVTYLIARTTVGVFIGAIGLLQSVMLPNLVMARTVQTTAGFQGIVARASLGVMLIAGALALVGIMAAPIILLTLSPITQTLETFQILLLCASLPALLGLFPNLLIALVPPQIMALSFAMTSAVFFACVIVAMPSSARDLAICAAIAQFGAVAILSLVGFRALGLLPAVTAILHTAIRLRTN